MTYERSQQSRHACTLGEPKYSLRFSRALVIVIAQHGSGRPYSHRMVFLAQSDICAAQIVPDPDLEISLPRWLENSALAIQDRV